MKSFSLPRSLSAGAFLLLVLTVPWLTGCDDESLTAPEIQNDLFNSYVALGNSITAGFQSGGISSQTQSQSYARLLAEQMEPPFGVPELVPPGCPPPFTSFFDENGVPNPQRPDPACSFRNPQLPLQLNNVAVPGARVLDVLSNQTSSTSALTQFILGGRTQIEAALDANPTFATVWIGNNDVLDPALQGTASVTPQEAFESRYTGILDSLTSSPQFQGGVLIGVANVTFTPFFSPGPVYFALDQAGQFPPDFDVASNCNVQDPNTGLTPLVPLSFGFTLLGQAAQGQSVTLDCEASNTGVLTLAEVGTLAQTVQQYNAFIQQEANDRGLGYLNPNQVLGALYLNDDGDPDPTNDLIPKFPDAGSDQPFGQFFSLDGVHPSAPTHRVVAAQLVQVINETYDTSLSPPENVPPLPSGNNQ
jgi:hypothetical protein